MAETTIWLTVQTGMAARDLLRCGPLERLLAHPDVHIVLLSPGYREPGFLREFAGGRVSVVPHRPYTPTTTQWRLLTRRWQLARSPRMADWMHRLEERMVPASTYDDLFRQYPPSLVVSGDPLRPGDINLVAAARKHGVPSLGSVRSWDNTLKHLRIRPELLTVWNAINAREARDVDLFHTERVIQVGAPQLDGYFQQGDSAESRESFCSRLGLDPRKRILLLATSSFTYDSDQTYLVDLLLGAIRGGELCEPCQVVLRLHPDDRVGRYLKYRREPGVVLDIPEQYFATLGWTMDQADLKHLGSLVRHADVLINFATTLTLEAAIVDTPTVLVAFSSIDPEEMQRYVVGLHFKMHYRALVERDLVPVAWSGGDMVQWLNRYLKNPTLYGPQRKTIVGEWVQFTDGLSGRRLGNALLAAAGITPPVDAVGARPLAAVG